ncbi:GntR family transcriptional regulator [Tenggerimyces flavus]|uniref:Substrate-binding domain-containing protein n=1 Tax=Tenggerimyces flavus TaxID=1708749 RepID=A0ABV7YIJ8_9ACTN|nr:GntR family transcriptional regulator [Tenggerimyces flavus]MBM7787368.1 DNA-binding LacI/PurR family transcriptional regulator [Tenggerimyces flavus]
MSVERGVGRGPLYLQVKQALAELVGQDGYAPGARFVTEREVCERFGVSTTTAVRALNELVAERLLVRRQGSGTFVADSPVPVGVSASPPVPPRDHTVACILQTGGGGHVGKLLAGLEAALSEHGYRMYLKYSDNSAEREARAIREALAANVSGIVLYSAEGATDPAVFDEVRRQGVPIVLVDRYRPDVPTDVVMPDNLAIGYEVTERLIALGHTRIATLWHETDATSVRDRLAGHLKALRDHQIPVRPELNVLRRYEAGVVERLLGLTEPPTVLLCGNGYALAQAIEDLVALGLHVPGDIDVAGMDDAGPFDILPLTAVAARLPSRELGEQAGELLRRRMTSGEPYRDVQHVVLPIQVRTRDGAPGYLQVVAAD